MSFLEICVFFRTYVDYSSLNNYSYKYLKSRYFSLTTQDVNLTYIRRSEDVQDVF